MSSRVFFLRGCAEGEGGPPLGEPEEQSRMPADKRNTKQDVRKDAREIKYWTAASRRAAAAPACGARFRAALVARASARSQPARSRKITNERSRQIRPGIRTTNEVRPAGRPHSR